MSIMLRSKGTKALTLGLMLAGGVVLGPGSANAGFFDQLFGGSQTQPAPSYEQPPQPSVSPDQATPDAVPPAHKRTAAREIAPVRQKTTDLMSDKTLRPGDAVMMKTGVHIYTGPSVAKHSVHQFVPVDTARVISPIARAQLVAMDTTRNDPLESGRAPDTIASGRSASVSTPISQGFKITDARGASIRYVGP